MTARQARSQQTVLNLLRELQQEIDAQDLGVVQKQAILGNKPRPNQAKF